MDYWSELLFPDFGRNNRFISVLERKINKNLKRKIMKPSITR